MSIGRQEQAGFTQVETAVATLLLAIIMLGSIQYFTTSQIHTARATRSLLAWQILSDRLETALHSDYASLADSLAENSTPVTRGGYRGYRSTILIPVDDPLDGTAPADTVLPDYLRLLVTVAWPAPGHISDSISLLITPQRSWQ